MTLTKVRIEAFNKNDFTGRIGEFELPINPEQFTQSFKVERDRSQSQGSKGTAPKYKYSRPEEIKLDFTFDGTGVVPSAELTEIVKKEFDFRPAAIIERLDLLRPIFAKTTNYGHFGREKPEFNWEKTDMVETLKKAVK